MPRLVLAVLAALLLAAAPAAARPQTTVNQTIEDRDADNRLDTGPGERHVVRTELAPASPTRTRTRAEKLFFAQMSDTHIIDEESPLRVDFTDSLGGIFTSAYRAQEGISPQVLDQMVAQVRNTVSPVTQRRLDLVMTTGDNTDNSQLNETRWMIDTMDGAQSVDPDSGVAGACGPDGYDGPRGDRRYYEPDASDGEDGTGYSPREADNGRPSAMRDFRGLFEQMNEPFKPVGFDDLPWYAIFGNHDGLVQGNQPRNAALDAVATGCVKPTGLPRATLDALQQAGQSGDGEAAIQLLRTAILEAAAGDLGAAETVPSDPRRRTLRKEQWINEHFKTQGKPVGHGFANRPESRVDGSGHYAFSPRSDLRFIALDTVSEFGLEEGNVDHPQYLWLHEELSAADAAGQKVLVFAHHGLPTMGQPPASPFVPPGDTGGNLDPRVHFGNGPRNTPVIQPCVKTQREQAPDETETIRCLLLRHPSVVAFVNGHEHNNRVDPVPPFVPTQNGFWEINTASHIDWPQQSRVIDVVDNRDGTLSLFGTIVDHAASPEPGGGKATPSVKRLASISRELAFNDPQASHGEDGEGGGRGAPEDRNVELLLRDPFAAPPSGSDPGAAPAAPGLPAAAPDLPSAVPGAPEVDLGPLRDVLGR